MKTMYITIGEQTFTATLYDNETAEDICRESADDGEYERVEWQ